MASGLPEAGRGWVEESGGGWLKHVDPGGMGIGGDWRPMDPLRGRG